MSDFLNQGQAQMSKTIEHLKTEFSKLRVGRASVSMVDGVKVEAYGSSMTLKEVAALATPDAKSITIQPWDLSLITDIERGILAANLGITPMNDGKIIRINLPPLTEERRKEFVKMIKSTGEEAKVSLRSIRRQLIDQSKAAKDSGEATEDDVRRTQDEAQKLTDKFVKDVDALVESKANEVMSL